jgi:hypothetical protein
MVDENVPLTDVEKPFRHGWRIRNGTYLQALNAILIISTRKGRIKMKFEQRDLSKVGITIISEDNLILECDNCKQRWQPTIQRGGKLHRGYWHCPNGCNEKK